MQWKCYTHAQSLLAFGVTWDLINGTQCTFKASTYNLISRQAQSQQWKIPAAGVLSMTVLWVYTSVLQNKTQLFGPHEYMQFSYQVNYLFPVKSTHVLSFPWLWILSIRDWKCPRSSTCKIIYRVQHKSSGINASFSVCLSTLMLYSTQKIPLFCY